MRNIIGIILSVIVVIAITGAFEITPRIVGGQAADLGQFPYYAFLDIRSFGYCKYFI